MVVLLGSWGEASETPGWRARLAPGAARQVPASLVTLQPAQGGSALFDWEWGRVFGK